MIEAEIKKKIPKLETWEDVLTSNVFGLLELIEHKYLIDIVSKAKNHQSDSIKSRLKDKQIKNVELWKSFKNIGEPDILVTLDDDTFFIIEVKYFSHEHNKKEQVENEDDTEKYQENGQLKKYLNIEIENKKKSDFIIYLTANYQSLNVIQTSGSTSKACLDSIYHIHWDDFNEHLIEKQAYGIEDKIEEKIIDKIIKYLNFKGFTYWRGFAYKDEYDKLKIQKLEDFMQDNQKQQVTDIVNAFRVLNKDIRDSFEIMSNTLESKSGFKTWKKWEKSVTPTVEGYRDFTDFITDNTDNWYYLNCYGEYKEKVVGFTFIISVDYDEKNDTEYSDFIEQLDKNINKNTPMLCISGIYEPIKDDKIQLLDGDGIHYVDTILKFTDDWKNYEKEKIKYDEWIDVEVDYLDREEIKDEYEGWYKKAKVKIKHITDIASKEEAQNIIDDLIKSKI